MEKIKKIDLDFCILVHKEKNVQNLIKKVKEAYKKNKKFWSEKIPKFTIKLVYSREELNRLWETKTEEWFIAFADKKKIVLFSPEVIEKVSHYKKKDFFGTLTHEISHLFYQHITGTYHPSWLNEGVAMNLGVKDYYKKVSSRKIRNLDVKDFYNYNSKKAKQLYPFSFYSVACLLKKGKPKIIKLIKNYSKKPIKSNFEKQFFKIYKFPLEKLGEKINGN